MTLYALTDNKGAISKYPYDLRELRKSVSLPQNPSADILAEHKIVIIEPTDPPTADYTQVVTEAKPRKIDGVWQQSWTIANASQDEINSRTTQEELAVKAKRNSLLQQSDWTQLPDAPVDHAAWAQYRNELRQVKSQPGFPWTVTWPDPPIDDPFPKPQGWNPPMDPSRGQIYQAPDNSLWQWEQPRNSLGQYVADDLSTPEIESALTWIPQ